MTAVSRRELPETVADVVRRVGTRQCLHGLIMRHVPTGIEFGCSGSSWGPGRILFVAAGAGTDRESFPASECVFMTTGRDLERQLWDNTPVTLRHGRRRH